EGFTDNRLGVVRPGDLLSDLGYRVFSNQDLVAALGPADPSPDYGLDALFVVTDTKHPNSPPRIAKQILSNDLIHFEWDGEGEVFQLENTLSLSGVWLPCSPIIPDLSYDARWNTNGNR